MLYKPISPKYSTYRRPWPEGRTHVFSSSCESVARYRVVAVGRNPTATPLGSVVVYMYICKSWVAQLYSHAPTRPRHLLGG